MITTLDMQCATDFQMLPECDCPHEHWHIGQAGAFQATDCTDLARWHWHREGRSTAYGEGFATREEALAALDDYLASERAEPVQAQEEPIAPTTDTPEPVNALSEAPEPEIEPVELSDDSVKLPEEAAPDLAEAMRAMMARLDAIEATVSTLSADKAPIAEQAPAARAARSPAHERAIRRAWAERKARRGAEALAISAETCTRAAERQLAIGQRQFDDLTAERDNLRNALALAQQGEGEAMRNAEAFARRGNQHRERRLASAKRARRMVATARGQRDLDQGALIAANAYAAKLASERELAFEGMRAAEVAEARARAELAKLKQSLADPMQPERESDIARLLQERDQARNALAAVEARAKRQQDALDMLAGQFEAMVSRVARAEAAMRHAGLIAAA